MLEKLLVLGLKLWKINSVWFDILVDLECMGWHMGQLECMGRLIGWLKMHGLI